MGMSAAGPRIDILMAGNTLPEIRRRFGAFHQWYRERPDRTARYRSIILYKGEPLPDPAESDGWIISGASDSVSDGLPWLPAAKAGIARAVENGHAILGVCFGHQLLAVALGGEVQSNPQGWELGSAFVELTRSGAACAIFSGFEPRFAVYESHQETVVSLPPGAETLASNEMGLQSFSVGARAFGVQFHPEFNLPITRLYVALRGAKGIPASGRPDPRADDSRQVLNNFIKYIST